jgi:hypothetical protein
MPTRSRWCRRAARRCPHGRDRLHVLDPSGVRSSRRAACPRRGAASPPPTARPGNRTARTRPATERRPTGGKRTISTARRADRRARCRGTNAVTPLSQQQRHIRSPRERTRRSRDAQASAAWAMWVIVSISKTACWVSMTEIWPLPRAMRAMSAERTCGTPRPSAAAVRSRSFTDCGTARAVAHRGGPSIGYSGRIPARATRSRHFSTSSASRAPRARDRPSAGGSAFANRVRNSARPAQCHSA